MGEFYSDLKSILGLRMLGEVVLGMRRNDLLGLAGQLAYFFLLFFFPFLIFLVSLTGLVIGNPEAGLKNLFEVFTRLVPANAQTLVVDYVDRTLRTASTGTLVLGILGALWLGQAVSISITKAANRSYRSGEPTVLAFAQHLPDHNLGLYATHRGPDPRGVQRRGLPLAISRSAGKPPEPREALELGHGLRRHHCGPRCALLPGPRRQGAVQVDHTGRVYGDHSAVLS